MSTNEVKDQHNAWLAALSTSNDTTVCELAGIIFDLSCSRTRLETVLAGENNAAELKSKKDTCLSLLTSSLTANGIRSLAYLEGMPLGLVSLIPKVPFNGWYLPHYMVAPLVLVREYLGLRRVHPSLPGIRELTRLQLDIHLSSWSSAKHKGLFPCDEKVLFDGNSDRWPRFRIKLTVILIKHGLREILLCARVGASDRPERLFFQSMWLGGVLKIVVNNCLLRWPMDEGDKDDVALLLWMKIKYESTAKLDPLRIYYSDKMRSLKLRVNESLHDYIDRFHGLPSCGGILIPPCRRKIGS